MDVHAGARAFGEGLGHEAGDHAVLFGDALDEALVLDRFVDSLKRVGAVGERDFHLAGRIF